MTEPALPSEVLEVIERAAEQPSGLEILEQGGVEAVAVLFGVRPSSVEAARLLAAAPRRRAPVLAALARAKQSPRPARAAPQGEPQKDAQGLLEEIERVPGGLELLEGGADETLAILFGAHPFVVAQARELARTRSASR